MKLFGRKVSHVSSKRYVIVTTVVVSIGDSASARMRYGLKSLHEKGRRSFIVLQKCAYNINSTCTRDVKGCEAWLMISGLLHLSGLDEQHYSEARLWVLDQALNSHSANLANPKIIRVTD
jgi:uncharacterized membrane protein